MKISTVTVSLLLLPLLLQWGRAGAGEPEHRGRDELLTTLSDDQTKTIRADSLNMRLVGRHPSSWATRGVAVRGRYAYVADFMAGFRVISVEDPENPFEVGFYLTPGEAEHVFIDGSYAYVADGSEDLRIISITDPANPVEVGFYNTSDAFWDVEVHGSNAYAANANRGMRVVSVLDPENPVEIGAFDTPGYSWNVTIEDTMAYIADASGGLLLVSIADPTDPVEVGLYETPDVDNFRDVAVSPPYAYTAEGNSGFNIYSISDPANPVLLGSYDTSGYSHVLEIDGSLAYIADGAAGVRVIDFSDRLNPTEVGYYNTSDYSVYLDVYESYVYVADRAGGLLILEFTGPTGIEDQTDEVTPFPRTTTLSQNYPNPFNPSTTITFDIPGEGRGNVRLDVFDIRGRHIRTLIDSVLEPGDHQTTWDGRNDRGLTVPSGIYFYTLKTGGSSYSRKMTVMK